MDRWYFILLISVSNRCPAIILAVNRTDKVIGRIKFLIVSIITINGIKSVGVLWGIRWMNIFELLFIHPYNINPNHIGIENVKLKLR